MNRPTAPRLPPTLVRLTGPAPAGTLVFMHDLGGSVFYARSLVQQIAGTVGCVGTRLDARLHKDLDRLTVPELGRRLAEDIARAALPGPLHLGGFSFAGYVAFEAARHLATLGVQVDTLWQFDSEILRKVPGYRPWSAPLAETRRILGYTRRNWRVMLGGKQNPDVLHVYGDVPMYLWEHPEGCREIIRGLYPAMIAYRPRPWMDGPGHPRRTIVIRGTQERRYRGFPEDLGWRQLLPQCDVMDVSGKHLGLMTDPDSVAEVAAAVHNGLAAGTPTQAPPETPPTTSPEASTTAPPGTPPGVQRKTMNDERTSA
ncbi:alpha/beta fold hydrolase [Paracoccus sp. Z118]|uniref:thioesterase domain-containing protein n=1 Tax=Paracoccus sp. Z118 TaxID=2851017 RepID=UPI001C2BEE26|nr:alpha/beta fold hydrolase [Paracoccus sp. Z118]MBV0892996.1 alpha/beta fold hydrolase [Paracoccus sp. Z118]